MQNTSGRAWCLGMLCLLGLCLVGRGQTTITLSSTTYLSGETETINAPLTITTASQSSVIVNPGAKITFSAGLSVTLNPGFHALSGSVFRASVDSDHDGIPDAWEVAHQLNPNDGTDATLTDSNGRTYLLSYQLGVEPGHASISNPSQTQLNVHVPN